MNDDIAKDAIFGAALEVKADAVGAVGPVNPGEFTIVDDNVAAGLDDTECGAALAIAAAANGAHALDHGAIRVK